MTAELIAFLRARLDEDEADAKEADRAAGWRAVGDPWSQHPRTDVGRMLREVEAKRAVLAIHTPTEDLPGYCPVCITARVGWPEQWNNDQVPCPTLRHLATVCRDHPDYRQEWRP